MTAQCCTLTKSYTVLAWQLTTANIYHVLSLGWERESASDAPDRTNRWWWWGEFFFPVSLPCGPVLDTQLPQRVARLGHSPFWCSSAFCLALLGIWRLPNGFQVCKHINIEAGRETRTRHATYYCWWEIGKDPSPRNVTTDWCLSDPPITFLEKKKFKTLLICCQNELEVDRRLL